MYNLLTTQAFIFPLLHHWVPQELGERATTGLINYQEQVTLKKIKNSAMIYQSQHVPKLNTF